jgi:Flp pilus assembly protein TadD
MWKLTTAMDNDRPDRTLGKWTIGMNIRRNRLDFLVILLLATVTAATFWQTRNHAFVNFDDDLYVTKNHYVQAGLTLEGMAWSFSFTNKNQLYWHPLTWFSHMLDCQLYQLNPGMHHSTNLLLHIANSLLLFLGLRRMTGALWRSAFVAALFALHPINVDSVAWVAARKNLLSTLFWMLNIIAYTYYSERPGFLRYMLTLSVFALGLLAKPMVVTLPFVLLLLDYWPLRRLRFGHLRGNDNEKAKKSVDAGRRSRPFYLVVEKVPFLALSGGSVYLSCLSLEPWGSIISAESVPMKLRISNALVSYVSYIGKMIWPHNLAVFYPPPHMLPMLKVAIAALILASISVLVVLALRRFPYLVVGWLWYVGTLVPVIGFVQWGLWPAMADRWAYIPLIGLSIIIAWGATDLVARWRCRSLALSVSAGVALSALVISTYTQLQHWQNSITLFQHALNVTTDNWLAHGNLGNALARQGKSHEAIAHFSAALRIKPYDADVHNNMGNALAAQEKLHEAIDHFSAALRIDPHHAGVHYNLGNALARQGRLDEAIDHFSEAVRINTEFAIAHNNLGIALASKGRPDEAITHFSEALRIDPNFVVARRNMKTASQELRKTGNDARMLSD